MEDQGLLIQFLKPVFDACDFNGDGFVKLQDLIALGREHSAGDENLEELESALRGLDPEGNGRITFEDFCQRWKDISSGKAIEAQKVVGTSTFITERETRQRSYTDSEGFFEEQDSTSHSTTSTTDYCGDLDEVLNSPAAADPPSPKSKQNLSIYSTYPPKGVQRHKRTYPSIFLNEHLAPPSENGALEIEEGFEGFGERSDGEDSLSAYSDYSGKRAFPSTRRGKRLSGSLVARQLRLVQSANTSLHNSMEELALPIHAYSDSENNINQLSDQLQRLSSQVSSLQNDHLEQEGKQKRLREENKSLIDRLSALEEQLDQQRTLTSEQVEAESQRHKAALVKLQRDNASQLEVLQLKLAHAEDEIDHLKSNEPMLRKELELCLEERRKLQAKYDDLQSELQERIRESEQLKIQLQKRREELEYERRERVQEVAELTQRLEEYKEYRREARSHCDDKNDLIQQIEMLKIENERLRNSKDDLKAELLHNSSFYLPQKRESLAAELVSADKDDILSALKDMEDDNYRMRQYVDQLLMVIMESDPALLEKS